MKRRYWTDEDVAVLRATYARCNTANIARTLGREPAHIHAKAQALGLKKSRELIAAEALANSQAPGHGFKLHQFRKGQMPLNKGVKGWDSGGRSHATRFKAGERPHTWMPIGSYRLNKGDGNLERKVNDLPGANHIRWKPVHRLVWEAVHGPVPDGQRVVFKPGRHSVQLELITLDAVELVDMAELMRRNSVHRLPPEFAELARLRGLLVRAINRKAKEAAAS